MYSKELIKKIAIVTNLGAEVYWQGQEIDGEIVDKIFMDNVTITGDPFSHYCGYSEKGKLLFTINPHCPCVVDFL